MSSMSKTAAALLIGIAGTSAATKLFTHAPHGTWNEYPATIEEMSVSVKPKGIFSEVGVYLTISERGNTYYYPQDADSQEIVLDFELPANAVVNDLWLWVGDDIVQGKIMDKETASSIFNGIVKQKKDPSIIYKQSATQYQIRIYPLLSGKSRKIKLAYLLPSNVVGKDFITEIPGIELVKKSKTIPASVNLILKPSPEGVYPEIMGSQTDVPVLADSSFGNYKGVKLGLGTNGVLPAVKAKDALKNGWYLTTHAFEGENYFQVTTIPAAITAKPRKIVFLLDYQNNKSDISKIDLCSYLKTAIQKFGSSDSVNILYSNLVTKKASENWVEGKSINEVSPDSISSYSNLSALFKSVATMKNVNDIVLISTNNEFSNQIAANDFRKEIITMLGQTTPIHVVDLATTSISEKVGNKYYYNNEYLYTTLTELTGGTHVSRNRIFNQINQNPVPLVDQLKSVLKVQGTQLTDFTMKTGMENGFTYGEYDSQRKDGITFASEAVTRVGKFNGSGAFTIESYFTIDGKLIAKKDTISPAQTNVVDSTLRQFWYGFKINDIESKNPSKDQISELITMSTKNRVLSKYTSFLCLEPSDTVSVCEDCFDETKLKVGVKESVKFTGGFSCFFANQILKLNLPEDLNGSQLTISLFNLKGQIVKQITLDDLKAGQNGIVVNLKSEQIAAGNYIVKISGSGITHSLKITLL